MPYGRSVSSTLLNRLSFSERSVPASSLCPMPYHAHWSPRRGRRPCQNLSSSKPIAKSESQWTNCLIASRFRGSANSPSKNLERKSTTDHFGKACCEFARTGNCHGFSDNRDLPPTYLIARYSVDPRKIRRVPAICGPTVAVIATWPGASTGIVWSTKIVFVISTHQCLG